MPKYTIEKIRTLPQPALDNFYSLEVNDRYSQEIFPLLTDEEEEKLYDLMFDVYFRVTTPGAFVASLGDFLKDEKKRGQVASHMLGYVFLPIADYLQADVAGLISQVGGDPNLYKKKVAVSDVLAQIKKKAAVPWPAEERIAKRLDSIVGSRVMDVRKDEQARELLMGPTKTSGCGLDEATAQKILFFANEELTTLRQRGIDIVPDEQLRREEAVPPPAPATSAPIVQPSSAEPATVQALVPPPPKKVESLTFSAADLKEVQDLAKKSQPSEVAAETAAAAASLLDGIVDETVTITKVSFPDEDLQKRYRTAVSLYFRDLRDALETKSKFTMPVAQGGLGFSAADTDRIMSVLAAKAGEFRELMSSRASASKQRYVELQTKKVLTAEEEMLKREQEELERRFAELTAASKKGSPPPVPKVPGTAPKVIPVIAVAKTPAPAPKPIVVAPPNLPIEPAPAPKPAMPPMPIPAPMPQLPRPAAPPPPAAISQPVAPSKPTMADVTPIHKLVGPVEELRQMTIKDFRRLSKDPKEATLKIKDKIDLMGEQSFDVKTQGIKAWQDSEPSRLYLDLLKRSLEGRPVADLIADREAKSEPTLSKAEFDAIMVLNRTLRFG
ncbi:hypothetical protein HY633_02910 [Candidatus Uhrbacteria bacterium]|nr:hypothetical protein [Candidatus Uhrbacteria bacterium]